jgi:hypothetical protein
VTNAGAIAAVMHSKLPDFGKIPSLLVPDKIFRSGIHLLMLMEELAEASSRPGIAISTSDKEISRRTTNEISRRKPGQ